MYILIYKNIHSFYISKSDINIETDYIFYNFHHRFEGNLEYCRSLYSHCLNSECDKLI